MLCTSALTHVAHDGYDTEIHAMMCPMASFRISSVESLGSAARVCYD
jgi:hypothetical protein